MATEPQVNVSFSKGAGNCEQIGASGEPFKRLRRIYFVGDFSQPSTPASKGPAYYPLVSRAFCDKAHASTYRFCLQIADHSSIGARRKAWGSLNSPLSPTSGQRRLDSQWEHRRNIPP
jgi:hypothetical protein